MDKEQSINKRVSIVIPVYNSHKTLPRCLDSMIAQTYQELEIICVNDCSKDNSIDIINKYQQKDSRVKLVNHTENRNAGGARNSGIKAATGTYVCFVDNDDWMTPDAIELLVLESNDCTIDFVAPDWREWYSENKQIEYSNLIANASKDENCEHALKYGCRILGCLIRRDIFFKNDLFFPERIFWEDNAIGASLLYSSNEIKAVKKVLYYYKISSGSSSHSFNLQKTRDRIKTTRLSYENLKRLGFVNQKNELLVNFRILCLSYFTIKMLAINASAEAKQELQSVNEMIKQLLPNRFIKKLRPSFLFTLYLPLLAYYFWAFAYRVKRIISN